MNPKLAEATGSKAADERAGATRAQEVLVLDFGGQYS
ncbi:MAG: hypothetical protein QOJ14_292, partial [Thermoleophilaceae bacterium]|nr:hypothetical protein [Thermoleophilaceae bacterium]